MTDPEQDVIERALDAWAESDPDYPRDAKVQMRAVIAVVLEDMLAKVGVRYREDAWTAAYIREYSEKLGIKLPGTAND